MFGEKKETEHYFRKLAGYLFLLFITFILFDTVKADASVLGSGRCGYDQDKVYWKFENTGTLTIYGFGHVEEYSRIYEPKNEVYPPWYSYRHKIKKIIIEEGIFNASAYAFYDCVNLTEVDLADSVAHISDMAFYGCKSLKSITIPENVYMIYSDAFMNCKSLTDIHLPASVRNVGDGLFAGCSKLKNITVEEGSKYFFVEDGCLIRKEDRMIMAYSQGRTGSHYTLPDSAKGIGDRAFYGSSNLTDITVSDNITFIGIQVFKNCTNLKKITIPKKVKTIWHGSFDGCGKLSDIYYQGSKKQWSAIENDAEISKKTTIHYKNPVSKIRISAVSDKLAVGVKVPLTVNVSPLDATNKKITWSVNNNNYATISKTGVLKLSDKAKGKVIKVTAKAQDGSGKKAIYSIKAMKGVVRKITIRAPKNTLKAGKTMKLSVAVKATDGANRKLQWICSNRKYATINAKGILSAKKAGKGKSVKLTAMAVDGSGKKDIIKINIK